MGGYLPKKENYLYNLGKSYELKPTWNACLTQ